MATRSRCEVSGDTISAPTSVCVRTRASSSGVRGPGLLSAIHQKELGGPGLHELEHRVAVGRPDNVQQLVAQHAGDELATLARVPRDDDAGHPVHAAVSVLAGAPASRGRATTNVVPRPGRL